MKKLDARRVFAGLFAFVIAFCMMLKMPEPIQVRASSTTGGNEPSVTAFATKEQLMTQFTLANSDNTQNTVGYINFGKDESGNTVKWYIVGKDAGITGDNVVLFASDLLVRQHIFESVSNKYRTYDASWGCQYEGTTPVKVQPNHYGASDVRVTLQGLVQNTSYFSAAEQMLMNTTTVKVKDTYSNSSYTVSDKLYLGQGDQDAEVVRFGSDDGLVACSDNWGSEGVFYWLRTPHADYPRYALKTSAAMYIGGAEVDYKMITKPTTGEVYDLGIQPAFDLNLSSVLFASAATSATSANVLSCGRIDAGTGMNLKLDGSAIMSDASAEYGGGLVTFSGKAGDVVVIQGNDGTSDWYYSKYLEADTANGVIDADEIKAALGLSVTPNLNKCKVWIERNSK